MANSRGSRGGTAGRCGEPHDPEDRMEATREHRTRLGFVQAAVAAALVFVMAGCVGSPTRSSTDSPPSVDAADRAEIERVLHEQDLAWNRGDLHGFVAGYAEGERMTFV